MLSDNDENENELSREPTLKSPRKVADGRKDDADDNEDDESEPT